jgi:GT2 family glycosyltransferase
VKPETLDYLRGLQRDGARVLQSDGPFNFSALVNEAARTTECELLLLLNNDTEVVTPGWIEAMLEHALRLEVGAVGAKLLFPNGTLQHAGVVLGLGPAAGHGHHGLSGDTWGYMGRVGLIGNYSAVTAACLMVRREAFWRVGGLDEVELRVNYGDVDLCLRLAEIGLRTVYTPYACLRHHESASRPRGHDWDEIGALRRRWRQRIARDPYYSPHLSLTRTDFGWDPPLGVRS